MQIEITPELLAELKEKAGKATKGNWFSTCDDLLQPVVNCVALDRYENRIATFEDSPYSEKDADFIALANPTVILALIAKIEQLEKEAEWLAARLQTICKHEIPDVCAMLDVTKCPFFPCGEILMKDGRIKCKCELTNWRNAAKEAIKANE